MEEKGGSKKKVDNKMRGEATLGFIAAFGWWKCHTQGDYKEQGGRGGPGLWARLTICNHHGKMEKNPTLCPTLSKCLPEYPSYLPHSLSFTCLMCCSKDGIDQ